MLRQFLRSTLPGQEAEAKEEAKRFVGLSPLGQLIELLNPLTRPPVPNKKNTQAIGMHYRGLDINVAGGVIIAVMASSAYAIFLALSPSWPIEWSKWGVAFVFATTITFMSLYTRLKTVNHLWGLHYMPLAERRFAEHSEKIYAAFNAIQESFKGKVTSIDYQTTLDAMSVNIPYLQSALRTGYLMEGQKRG